MVKITVFIDVTFSHAGGTCIV